MAPKRTMDSISPQNGEGVKRMKLYEHVLATAGSNIIGQAKEKISQPVVEQIGDAIKKGTLYTEGLKSLEQTTGEFRRLAEEIRSWKDQTGPEADSKRHRLLALYVAPTVHSDFKYLVQTKPKSSDTSDIPELEKWHLMPRSEPSIPMRMIDIDTGNLVETRNFGPLDQYCILSHTWKGLEIDWGYLSKAKRLGLKHPESQGDVGAVMSMSKNDACNALRALQECIKTHGKGNTVDEVLEQHLRLHTAERRHASASKKAQQAQDCVISTAWETNYYEDYYQSLGEVSRNPDQEDSNDQAAHSLPDKVRELINGLKSEADRRKTTASEEYSDSSKELSDCEKFRDYFRDSREIVPAIEDMLLALYYCKSAKKLHHSVEQAKHIFDNCSFPSGRRRYIWLDNCCIRKSDAGELTESLARMGEWYANAAFCLVHIDTPQSDKEWMQEYQRVLNILKNQSSENSSTDPTVPSNSQGTVVKTYEELSDSKTEVQWATRGWTLQELVLSRVTYYFNADWTHLSREIGRVGQFYYLVPFIKQYLERYALPPTKTEETVKEPMELISNLTSLGLALPMDLQRKSATNQIGRMVSQTAENMTSDQKNKLNQLRPESGASKGTRISALNSLLWEIVQRLEEAIQDDRKRVQKIGRLSQLGEWHDGTDPVKSSARSIIMMASERNVTVPVDQVYSLMGILGVQFPVFPAEGISKALCRLIDEVVMASNDVSVFNWGGRHMGSPIRGRSLYPRTIEAFNQTDDPITNARKEMTDYLMRERVRRGKIVDAVLEDLRKLMETTTKLKKGCEMLDELERLFGFLDSASFEAIQSCVSDMRDLCEKLEKYDAIQEKYDTQKREEESSILSKAMDHQSEKLKGFLSKGKMGLPFSRASSRSSRSNPQLPSSFLEDKETAMTEALDDLQACFKNLENSLKERKQELPPESASDMQWEKTSITELDETDKHRKLVCPNPITVTSAGVRGVFDIQRVVIQMKNLKTLRRKVALAVEGEMIEGSCTVSNGFSCVLISFTCTREVLQDQLDITEVIKRQLFETQNDKSPAKNDDHEEDLTAETPRRRNIRRMVQFVQADDPRSIDGEWVLARFSDVEGAEWFLCRFELGSGNKFYGRRIATEAFTFADGIPEAGLVDLWEQFMREQRHLICQFSIATVQRKRQFNRAEKVFDEYREKVDDRLKEYNKDGQEDFAKILKQLVFKSSSIYEVAGLFYCIPPALLGTYYWVFAGHLKTKIHEDAIRSVPVILRGAIKAMSDPRPRFPMMYHPSQDVHMF